jgi:hypothetical protein
MVVPQPGEEPRLFAFVRPFQPAVGDSIIAKLFVSIFHLVLHSNVGLVPPFHNYDRNGVFHEPVFENFVTLHQEKEF